MTYFVPVIANHPLIEAPTGVYLAALGAATGPTRGGFLASGSRAAIAVAVSAGSLPCRTRRRGGSGRHASRQSPRSRKIHPPPEPSRPLGDTVTGRGLPKPQPD